MSNDNAYSESQFKTMKYQPDYPKRFETLEAARIWCAEYVNWYNKEHYHSELELYTPKQVFTGEYEQVAQERDKVLGAAFERNPERFVRGRSRQKMPPTVVRINPLSKEAIDLGVTAAVNILTLKRVVKQETL